MNEGAQERIAATTSDSGRLLLDVIDASGYRQASTNLPSLTPGETRLVGFTLATAGVVGRRSLTARVAGVSAPVEIRVANPDFRIAASGIAIEPERSATNEPVTARVTVDNLGTLGASASVRLYPGYAETGDLAASGTVFVAAGGAAVVEVGPFLPPSQPPYVVTVVLDEEAALVESDETNNRATRPTLKRLGETIVAFDETHLPGGTVALNPDGSIGGFAGNLSDFVSDLKARGYSVVTLDPNDAGLTPSLLRGVDVVVNLPSKLYREDELEAIQAFIRGGGGYFFLAEWGGGVDLAWAPVDRQLSGALGVHWVETTVFAGGPCSALSQPFSRSGGAILDHPITTGVQGVLGLWPGGFDGLPTDASILIRSPATWQVPNTVVAAAFPMGQGRVVVHGDSNAFDADFSGPSNCGMWAAYRTSNNARFGLQVVDWLAGLGTLATFGPDLAFVGGSIQTPATTITEGAAAPLTVRVRNVGGATAEATTVRLYDGPSGGRLLHEASLPALPVDQEIELTFTWDTTAQAGKHTLTAVVDPEDAVAEFNEGNNVVQLAVTVQSRADLRVDPTDISMVAGSSPAVRVRVHNLGVMAVPSGGALELHADEATGSRLIASAALPAVPARGAVTVEIAWPGTFPQSAYTLRTEVSVPAETVESDPANNTARLSFEPPRLEVAAPLAGAVWGGTKSVRWVAGSDTRPAVTVHAALARAGSSFTGSGTGATGVDVDTRPYADGDYVLRVTADDGLQAVTREIPFRIDNASPSVRVFGTGTGVAAVAVPAAGGATTVLLPAGSRATSASLLLDSAGVAKVPLAAATSGSNSDGSLLSYRGLLHAYYLSSGQGFRRTSADEGATWSEPVAVTPAGVTTVRASANSHGVHIVYQMSASPRPVYYAKSADGQTLGEPVELGAPGYAFGGSNWIRLRASDEGVAVAATYTQIYIAWADPGGNNWTPLTQLAGIASSYVDLVHAAGRLHVVHGGNWDPLYYRSIRPDEPADTIRSAPAAQLSPGGGHSDAPHGFVVAGNAVNLAYEYYIPWMQGRFQRCALERDCSQIDSWLPEFHELAKPIQLSPFTALLSRGNGVLQALWQAGTTQYAARSNDGGLSWTEPYPTGVTFSGSAWLPAPDYVLQAAGNLADVTRWPVFTPRNQSVDVGADGVPEAVRVGMQDVPLAANDLAMAFNAYLASHADTDDGVADGKIAVPVAVSGAGAGSTVLRNLEVRYQAATALAGLAEPPLFSPGQSPGVLDATMLSTLGAGDIAVAANGGVVRSLSTVGAGGRWAAMWDGRDAAGVQLPSGVYAFGSAGGPVVATVEIDDIPPVARLDASSEGSHGGVATIRGLATDLDWAGSAKNFGLYSLEYSVDGSTWSSIAVAGAPADGVLGRWDTTKVGSASATLRLTVRDRAGNVSVDARSVGVSPGAPLPPVITSPTLASTPVDVTSSTVAIGGTADPGTTVTVYRDGASVGAASSDGHWTVAGVALPPGVSHFTASSTLNGVESARSQAVTVGQYALALSVSAPGHVAAGTGFQALVSVQRMSALATPLRVRVSALDSAGKAAFDIIPREAVLTFPATGSASLEVSVDPGSSVSGSYRLRAEVASGSLVPASAEAVVTLDPTVQIQASLTSDREAYDAMQLVSMTGRVANTGTSSSGPLAGTITVLDPAGQVSTLGPVAISSLAPLSSTAVSALYGIPPLQAGTYQATLEVRDELGALLGTGATSFLVRPAVGPGSLTGTLLVNPTTYAPGDTLQASFTLTNLASATTVPVSVVLLTQATNAVVARWDGAMPLAAGAQGTGSASLTTALANGEALIAVLLGNGRALAAQAVEPALLHDTTPPVITVTGFTDGEYRSGSVTPVVAISDESPFTSTTSLEGQAYESGTPVSGEGPHQLVVQATDAWNNSSSATRSFTIDTSPPSVTVTGIHDGALRQPPVMPSVLFQDSNLRDTRLELDGTPWVSWGTITEEGLHVLSAWADDRAGNSTALSVGFELDGTPPAIEILGVSSGELTRDTVFPVIRVVELHPGTEVARLDGGPWDGLPVVADGEHRFEVDALDAAGNAATLARSFTIDKTPPVISLSGVTDGMLVNHPVAPLIAVNELHPGTTQALLDGVPWPGGAVSPEGSHLLRVEAVDAAGNLAAPISAAFAIDTTPPRIAVAGVAEGQVSREAVAPVVTVDDLHPGSLDVLLDGAPFVPGTAVSGEGDHLLVAAAIDAAGNAAVPLQVSFTRDTIAPVVTIVGVAAGGSYEEAWPGYTVNDLHPGSATAAIDGLPLTEGTSVRIPGAHTFSVTATDLAGNTASSSVTFEIVGGTQAAVSATFDSANPRVLVALDCDQALATCIGLQAGWLQAALVESGIVVEFTHDNADFLTKLRELRHNVRVLYLVGQTAVPAFRELRELTYEGGGLVVVDDYGLVSNPALIDTVGVTSGTKVSKVGSVTFSAGDLGPARSMSLLGAGAMQTLHATTALAVASSSKGIVASTNRYGLGRVATLTFNPEANDTAAMKEVLVAAVRFAASGAPRDAVPRAPQYLAIESSMSGTAGPLEVRLDAWTGAGLVPLSGAGVPVEPPLTWVFPLSAAASDSRSVGVVAPEAGTYPLLAQLTALGPPEQLISSGQLDVVVLGPISVLAQAAIAATQAIPAGINDAAKAAGMAHLSAIDPAPASRGACDAAITGALDATDDLKLVTGQDAVAARLKTDQLLRALQALQSTLP